MDTATVYQDRDNTFTATIKKNGVALSLTDMQAITKFEIRHRGKYYNSDDHPTAFVRNDDEGTVTIKPYELGLTKSKMDAVELLVYDAAGCQHGLVWGRFNLVVSGAAPAPVPAE